MATNKLANLKSQLLTSGLSGKDQPLFQIINQLIQYLQDLGIDVADLASSSSSGGSGITSLNTDVVATGPGAAVATIQPNVVSYGKIQQVVALRLLGNPNGSVQDVVEIPLGDNLAFVGGVLEVQIEPGTGGLLHRVLSSTHYDSIPATAEYGDIIYATAGPDLAGEYYGFIILAPVVENFVGIRWGYSAGFHGAFTPTYSMGYCAPNYDFVPVTPPDTLLAFDYIDAFILAPLVEDSTGIRSGYTFTDDPVAGNYAGYYPPELSFIVPFNPANDDIPALWTRKAIGAESQVLTVVDGIPEWENLPPIPAEPSYPWQDIPYDAANFTASGGVGPTWTVAAGDVTRFQYQQFPGVGGIGNNVRIAILLETTTVGGTAPTQLQITLPFNIIGRFAQYISILEAGPTAPTVAALYDGGIATNKLFIDKLGGAVFDTTADSTYLSLEISAVLAP